MAIDSPTPRSRRAILAGAIGGVAGLVAGRLGRPDAAAAAAGSPLIVGANNDGGTSQTILRSTATGASFTLRTDAIATGSTGIFGHTASTQTYQTRGVYGLAWGPNSDAIQGVQGGTAGTGAAVRALGGSNSGVIATTTSGARVAVQGETSSTTANAKAIYGIVTPTNPGGSSTAVRGQNNGTAASGIGVYGSQAGSGWGVYGFAPSGRGVYGSSSTGNGLYAFSNGSGRNAAAVRSVAGNATNGMAGFFENASGFHTAHFANTSSGGVLYLENGGSDAAGTGGGDFITAVNNPENDAQFRVLTSGEVRSDVGFNTPAADFAEMLPASDGLEPGDVLAIGADGRLERSRAAHQANVAGVYSTRPGFVGGHPTDGPTGGTIPLAVVGIVPVKASAENGPIGAGDLLASSSTVGHAMRANGEARLGCVIGKALEPLAAGTGQISMLVVLQ